MNTLNRLLSHDPMTMTVKVGAILLASLAFYWQDLTILANEAVQSEFLTHIIVVPFLFVYLIYRKRKMLKAVILFKKAEPNPNRIIFSNVTVGTILCLLAIIVYWYGSYTFTALEYHMVSFIVFVVGCLLIMFNTFTLRVLAFPIAFLIFLIPPPLQVIYTLGSTMSFVSSQTAYTILKAIGLPVSLAEQYATSVIILQKPNSQPLTFAVDIACSGIYSLLGFLIFALFVAYISKGVAWKKTVAFLVGFPLIYSLNILRITIIVLIGNQYGTELALQVFHLLGGWVLIILGTLLLLLISERILKIHIITPKTATNARPTCAFHQCEPSSFCTACGTALENLENKLRKQDLAKIVALFATVLLLLSIQAPVFALTKGPAEVILQTPTGQQATTKILPEILGYTSQFVYRDTAFEQIAKQDASLAYAYFSTSKNREETIWVTIELAKAKYNLHSWEYCLITWPHELGRQPDVTQLDLRDIELLQNPPIIGRYFAFEYMETNQTQVVLYWYETATFQTNSTSQQEYVKITLIVYPENIENIQEIEDKMMFFAKAIVNHWQPIKVWSQIAIVLSHNGPTLIVTITLVITIIATSWLIQGQMQKGTNLRAYRKLSEKEKKILLALEEANRNHRGTACEIATTYKQVTKKEIELTTINEALISLKGIGLTKQIIANQSDQPILEWRTNIALH